MRIFVVGGAGFIGSHLVDRLLAEEHHVDVVDDLSTGSLGNLADARSTGGALKIHHLDGGSRVAASLVGIRRPDVIFHLAVLPRAADSPAELATGMQRCLNVLEAAREHSVGKVVVALPATALYGWPAVSALPLKEAEPVPRDVRGVVARSVLDLLSVYREHENVDFTALSIASVYGPRQPPNGGVVAAFSEAIEAGEAPAFHGDGRQTRDFVFIDDVVDALVRAVDRSSGLMINVGTGEETSVKKLWATMQQVREERVAREEAAARAAAEAAAEKQAAEERAAEAERIAAEKLLAAEELAAELAAEPDDGDADVVPEPAQLDFAQLGFDVDKSAADGDGADALAEPETGQDPVEPLVLPERRNELTRFSLSSVRARIHLGWSHWTELEEGLRRLDSAE